MVMFFLYFFSVPSGIRINFKATQKGQLQPRLESITEPLRGILSIPIKHHKPNNIRLLRAIWRVLTGAVEHVRLGRLGER